MNPWHEFFVRNESLVLFVHGQVFFVLGLVIAWQSRQHSRLDLARNLGWLGLFGIAHGLYVWGDVFIPIQATYLSQVWIETLLMAQTVLLAFSFAALFQFGVEALGGPYPTVRWIQFIPGLLLVVWMAAFLWTSQVPRRNATEFVTLADIWARYLLGIAGAVVAAVGLNAQTRQRMPMQESASLSRAFQVASLALVSYAVLGGLVVPPAPFFPASIINTDTVLNVLGVPVQVLRSVVGLVLVVSIVRGLEVFRIEVDRRLEEMEQAHTLMSERERISRELHDGAIQTVYTAGLIAESVRKKLPAADPLAIRLDSVISALDHAIHDLRQFIGNLEPKPPGRDLVTELRQLADDSQLRSLVEVDVRVIPNDDALLFPTGASHVRAIVNEALSNIARHAGARHAWIVAERANGELILTIADDGDGVPDQRAAGFGLRNMRDRARLLGGTLSINPRAPRGTQVVLTIPWDGVP
jgi:signal transduction histidine kinase